MFYTATEEKIKLLMNENVGAIRHFSSLEKTYNELTGIFNGLTDARMENPQEFRVYNMLQNALNVTESAIARKDSIGAHYVYKETGEL